ncbi:MAG: M3 family oligoendopeptidase [Lachnospiraceae bacterium]|nr:M3 family oligoendopeptidase [Lachnospiraceae bacterium]
MNTEWSLSCLYQGYDDPAFAADMKAAENMIEELRAYLTGISERTEEEGAAWLINWLENYSTTFSNLSIYVSLRASTNTTDSETTAWDGKLMQLNSSVSKELAMVEKYLAGLSNLEGLEEKNPVVKEYDFYLRELKENASHMLSDEVEEVISKLNQSAGAAWEQMQQYLTSTVTANFRGEEVTLSKVRNMAYSEDASVRKDAYEAELACYDKIKDAIAFSMNNLKSQVNTIVELRGYESALDKTLKQSRMKKETLDAMLTAMKEYLPKFHEYLRAKAKLLGYQNGLPWYDLFAPVGECGKKYTLKEAKEYLISHFEGFAPDLAEMIRKAFDEEWIDFYSRAGKVGGAFCCHIPSKKQSRILTNYDGSLSDIVTLAHELGHAYHDRQIEDQRPLNLDYPMQVAETASTFNETVIMNAAIAEAKGGVKLALLESRLQDTTQIICDIYSRFLIENAVFEGRKERFFFAKDLCGLMVDAQKQAYGDGLDPEYLHPYMWACKSHYYSASLSYYNFPYAFGGLFARGLYAQYEKEGESFLPKYRALLKATTVKKVEDVAAMADIDITKPDFWRESLASIAKEIDEFVALADECADKKAKKSLPVT